MLEGKRIIYVHGFASSAKSGTVGRLRNLFPEATVFARDLPIHPAEAMQLLHDMCSEIDPHLIIGTSMGGMFTEQLYGYDRIVINPAFQIAETMQEHGMMGLVKFLNPREDGQTEFICNKALQAEYREVAAQCFSGANDDEDRHIYGLFGDEDPLVHTFDLFRQHYTKAIHFHGAHRLNDHALMHAVVPVAQWIDDRQDGRQRPVLFVAIEQTLMRGDEPAPSAQKAYRLLSAAYDTYIVADCPTNDPERQSRLQAWVEQYFGVPAYDRVVFANQRQLLCGDFLIDARKSDFMGTLLRFGDDPLKTWDDVITYFQRMGVLQ